jgi:hypothetical protein
MSLAVEWIPGIVGLIVSGLAFVYYRRERARMERRAAEREHRPAE